MTSGYDPERIAKQLRPISLDRVFRIVRAEHGKRPLEIVPAPSRFGDPEGLFSVLYASDAVRRSFWEAMVRNRFDKRKSRQIAMSEVEARSIVEIRSKAPLMLVDLRDDGPLRIAAPTAVAHDSNHSAGRALSAVTYRHVPGSNGFLFQSRFTGHLCIAVFDRALSKLKVTDVSPLVSHVDFLDALDDWEITLMLPVRRP